MMIAALAGGWPAKNSATMTAVATNALITSTRLTWMSGFTAAGGEVPVKSPRWTRATSPAVTANPASATGPSVRTKVV